MSYSTKEEENSSFKPMPREQLLGFVIINVHLYTGDVFDDKAIRAAKAEWSSFGLSQRLEGDGVPGLASAVLFPVPDVGGTRTGEAGESDQSDGGGGLLPPLPRRDQADVRGTAAGVGGRGQKVKS